MNDRVFKRIVKDCDIYDIPLWFTVIDDNTIRVKDPENNYETTLHLLPEFWTKAKKQGCYYQIFKPTLPTNEKVINTMVNNFILVYRDNSKTLQTIKPFKKITITINWFIHTLLHMYSDNEIPMSADNIYRFFNAHPHEAKCKICKRKYHTTSFKNVCNKLECWIKYFSDRRHQ